jgi:hypothetical protein
MTDSTPCLLDSSVLVLLRTTNCEASLACNAGNVNCEFRFVIRDVYCLE